MAEPTTVPPPGYRMPRRNGIIKYKRRYHKVDKLKRATVEVEFLSSQSEDECSIATHFSGNTLRDSLHFSSHTTISKLSSQLSTRKEIEEESRLREERRQPAKHHKDLMPLNELAMLMSSQLSLAKERGTFASTGLGGDLIGLLRSEKGSLSSPSLASMSTRRRRRVERRFSAGAA